MKNNIMAEQLFNMVQETQGHSFISDSIVDLDLEREDILDMAKTSLILTKTTVRILEKFIKSYEG
jgi:D-alanyl-D-alanine carboxypeptidase